jgi:hypothetical protein
MFTLVGQATLESALIHLRNVAEFIVSRRPVVSDVRKDDVVADHYFVDGWRGRPHWVIGNTAREHGKAMMNIHRRAMHLTTERLGGTFQWWEVLGSVENVFAAFRSFVSDLAVVHPTRAAWFDRSISTLDERQRDKRWTVPPGAPPTARR